METRDVILFGLLAIILLWASILPIGIAVGSGGSGSSSDTNKVLVSSNDTNADYLFGKLSAGTNISLAIINGGGAEKVQISAVSGSGGKTYTSGTPGTIQVNNDLNTISQNFDGNLWARVAPLFPVPDSNILNSGLYKANCDNNQSCLLTGKITTTQDINANNIKFNGTLSGGDFNYSLGDANGFQSCPGQALQSVGSIVGCVSVSVGSDTNKVAVSATDTNAGFLNQKILAGIYTSLTTINPGANEQLRINASTCDNNINCKLTSKLDINGPTVTLTKDPSFGSFILGDNNQVISIPLKTTCIFNAPLIAGCNGEKFYIGDPTYSNSIGLVIADVPSFLALFGIGTSINGTFWAAPGTLPSQSEIPVALQNGVFKVGSMKDGNYLYNWDRDLNMFVQTGTKQSVYSPNFLLQSGDVNGNVRFFGSVDFNQSVDVNGSGTFTGDVNITQNLNLKGNLDVNSFAHFDKNVEIDQNLTVDGNIMLPTGCLKISDIAICPNTIDGNGGLLIYDFQ